MVTLLLSGLGRVWKLLLLSGLGRVWALLLLSGQCRVWTSPLLSGFGRVWTRRKSRFPDSMLKRKELKQNTARRWRHAHCIHADRRMNQHTSEEPEGRRRFKYIVYAKLKGHKHTENRVCAGTLVLLATSTFPITIGTQVCTSRCPAFEQEIIGQGHTCAADAGDTI